ncbi:hypothetical protein AVEN_166771-1 [Araneus ventricosus]|uniref:Uncharacterized protein n=1 Tax=Araneus ventricosus TaxID=182803 RepID=A0A4Y2BQ24_ARAVE|nr:hypothetical protein AVEN_166771-1 [Araneus ventricosus]
MCSGVATGVGVKNTVGTLGSKHYCVYAIFKAEYDEESKNNAMPRELFALAKSMMLTMVGIFVGPQGSQIHSYDFDGRQITLDQCAPICQDGPVNIHRLIRTICMDINEFTKMDPKKRGHKGNKELLTLDRKYKRELRGTPFPQNHQIYLGIYLNAGPGPAGGRCDRTRPRAVGGRPRWPSGKVSTSGPEGRRFET